MRAQAGVRGKDAVEAREVGAWRRHQRGEFGDRERAAAKGLRLREEWHDYGSDGAPRFYSAGFVRTP